MAPNARTNVASAAATTRLRNRAMRAARARSLAWASSFGEGVCSVMERTVGGGCKSLLGAAWEVPERPAARPPPPRRALGHRPARTQPPPRRRADHVVVARLLAVRPRSRSCDETEGPQARRRGRRIGRARRRRLRRGRVELAEQQRAVRRESEPVVRERRPGGARARRL